METTKNKLPEDAQVFLNNLKQYLDKPLYFYGSIQRPDYMNGNDHTVIYGHKIMYTSKELSLPIEFAIYNEKNKKQVLYQHNSKVELPFYITFALLILKTIYYKLHLIEQPTYANIKHTILSTFIGRKNDYFIKI